MVVVSVAAVVVSAAGASVLTYDFTGVTHSFLGSHTFAGTFVYDNGVAGTTVYHPGNGNPVQRGFESRYQGALRSLSITLNNGQVVSGEPGLIQNNNIQQAGPGSQVPLGQSLQCYASNTGGTIDGHSIWYMYLAFLPVDPNFSWGPLDSYFNGDAESMLQSDPSILPSDIDPTLTGTALPHDVLSVFNGGLFLGLTYDSTTTVNTITSFHLRVPAPATAAIVGLAPVFGGRRRRM